MEKRINTVITYSLLLIWGILLMSGILTIVNPVWLSELSDPGKIEEATYIKNAADIYLRDNKYNNAIALYIKALKIVPDLKNAIYNLALAYQKTGNYNKSLIALKHLQTLNPEYPEIIYFNLGEIYEKTGQEDKALQSYLMSLMNAASPEKSFQKIGYIYMKQNDWSNAISNFKQAIDHQQNFANAYKGMLITNQKVFPDTSDAFREIVQIINSESYLNILDQYDMEIFNKQLSHDINLAKDYNNIGYCLGMQEKYEEAVVFVKRAIEINPSYIEAKNNLKVIDGLMND